MLGLVATAPAGAMPLGASQHYQGDAPGTVTCQAKLRAVFAPPMTNSTVPTNVNASGVFKNCSTSNPVVQKVKGILDRHTPVNWSAITKSPINCAGNPNAGATLGVTWHGRMTGIFQGGTFKGRAKYDPTVTQALPFTTGEVAVNGAKAGISFTGSEVDTGSFAGPTNNAGPVTGTLLTQYSPAQLAALCAGKGVSTLTFTGSITLG